MARAGRSFPSRQNIGKPFGTGNVSVALAVATPGGACPVPGFTGGGVALPTATVTISAPAPGITIAKTVSLVPATVTISAPAPAPSVNGVHLSAATNTITALPPGVVIGVITHLSTATVTISAPAPSVSGMGVHLPVAANTIGTPAPGLSIGKNVLLVPAANTISSPVPGIGGGGVHLTTAAVTIASFPPGTTGQGVKLTTATVTIAAPVVTPKVSINLALPVAAVTVAAHPPKFSRPLIISLASQSGVDDYGNSFPQGLMATEGLIQGPQFVADGAQGEILVYSGNPENGNLIGSWSGQSGTDPYSNSYPQGLNVTEGSISGSVFEGADFVIDSDGAFFYAGSPGYGNLIASIAPTSGFDQYGNYYYQGFYAATAYGITTGNVYMNPPMAVPANYPLNDNVATDTNSGTGWVSGERAFMNNNWVTALNEIADCVNDLIASLQNRGFIS